VMMRRPRTPNALSCILQLLGQGNKRSGHSMWEAGGVADPAVAKVSCRVQPRHTTTAQAQQAVGNRHCTICFADVVLAAALVQHNQLLQHDTAATAVQHDCVQSPNQSSIPTHLPAVRWWALVQHK
jgi:class 3 adenylate cyclase